MPNNLVDKLKKANPEVIYKNNSSTNTLLELNCNCGRNWLRRESDVTKIRSKVLVFKKDRIYLVCQGCNKEIDISVLKLKEDSPLLILKK